MSLHIVPHGENTTHIKRGLRAYGGIDSVALLTSETFWNVAIELQEELGEFGYQVEVYEIDPFNLRSNVDTIVSIAKEQSEIEIYINITGGTNLMAGAATASAFFIGASPYYVLQPQDDDASLDDLIIEIPRPTQPLYFEIEGLKRDILELLWGWEQQGRVNVSNTEIQNAVSESAQLVGYHLSDLEEKGLISRTTEGRKNNIVLTEAGKLYLNWTM